MDIRKEAVREYLADGIPYRALAKKYGVNRTTINRWVLVHQGIYNKSKQPVKAHQSDLEKKVELLEKQLEWEKVRSSALDTLINVAERELHIDIRKKPGTKQSEK